MSILMETKGDLQSILVNVGDRGRLVSQSFNIAVRWPKTAYDAAVRAVNKADRQLNDLLTNGCDH